MSTFAITNLIILAVIWLIIFYFVLTFNRKVDNLYMQLQPLSKKSENFMRGYTFLESYSISWIVGLIIFKYLICPIRNINPNSISRQIWIGIFIFIAIEIIGGIISVRFIKKS
ncbi:MULTISPECIES: hypothetical protein [Lactobacillus]|uniref:Uncharacterized protein n=1 Tax=Lactobacillus xujianguonis TaxID=2495899 RepID=A0A437SUA9_9LACO|nr:MULTISPECIES: hypothetical protein [Lactobacillus]RVU70474.1 hypothetical protein EJK17_07210 [Lactobacillus xujianguonis]RVU76856.1 hypothetical protein EJK20_03495 [Lactobacillus xujianguonis]